MKHKYIISLLLITTSVFAVGEKYNEIKKDLLTSDPLFMETHREEALTEKLESTSSKDITIPKRVPDKFVTILIFPYVDSADGYHDANKISHKYKSGKWIFGDYVNLEEQSDVEIEGDSSEFTYFEDGRK